MQVFISSETYQVRCLLFIVGAEPQRADQHRGLLLHLRPRARAAARHPRRGPARAQARQHSVILSQVDWKILNWIKGEFGLLQGEGWAWERGGGACGIQPNLPVGAGPRVRAVRLQDGPRRGEHRVLPRHQAPHQPHLRHQADDRARGRCKFTNLS